MNTNRKKPMILIVDDVPNNIQVLALFLTEKNYEVEIALSGISAIDILNYVKPDLILMDIMMPEMDGFEACTIVKSNPETKNIPVIFLTAKTDLQDIIKGFECGGVDYITKPFNKLELIARVNTHLELKFARETLEANAGLISEINKELVEIGRVKELYLEQINYELAGASQYIRSLLPEPFSTDFIEIDWDFVPSAQLGGDAFGYHYLDKEHLAIYLFDVSGHGISSALQSVSVLNVLKFHTLPNVDFKCPAEVLSGLNKAFQSKDHNFLFLTMWYGVYNLKTNVLRFSSAGHPHPLLLSNGKSAILNSNNIVIGALPNRDFSEEEMLIDRKSDMYIFSDGAFELKLEDGKIWGIKSLYDYLTDHNKIESNEITSLRNHIFSITGKNEFQDDFSILKIAFNPK